jgi:hypothetical protein
MKALKCSGNYVHRHSRSHGFRLALLGVATLVAAGACGSGSGSATAGASSRVNSADQVSAEINAEEASLELAPGWMWPSGAGPASTAEDGGHIAYEVGYGTNWADHYWYCSWLWHLVGAGPHAGDLQQTIGTLRSIRTKPFYQSGLLSPDKVTFDKLLDRNISEAIGGSVEAARSDASGQCPAPPALSPSASSSLSN